jgi:glyoxylase-like metal-dependent hydrolase (beta-lactamase superfamily II)
MQELRPGLWTWTARHPGWTPDQGGPDGWDEEVRSYAYDAGPTLVLLDPISPPSMVNELRGGKDVAILLTVHWHKRSSRELVEELGAIVFTPEASLERTEVSAKPYRLGDELPGGVVAQNAYYPEEMIFWIPRHRAIVAGDVLLGGERGLRVQPDSWLPEGVTPEALREALRPLLELPIELVLLTHGDPVNEDARMALAHALEA